MTKRILFWLGFIVVLGLIIWGLVVAFNKPTNPNGTLLAGSPAPISANDHVFGPENAPVTIIEYSDFQCPACETYYYLVTRLLSEASTTVRLVYRHFPLSQHANAMVSAQASEAAALQGKFWEMYDQIFSNHSDWTELTDPHQVFEGYAKKIGLNINRFKSDIDSAQVKERILAMKNEAESLRLEYTPTFFVNGKLITNPQSYDEFKKLIETAAKESSK